MDIQYSKCTLKDADKLAALAKQTFVDAFEKDNDPEDFWSYTNTAFSTETIERQLKEPKSHFYFVHHGSALIGYFKLNEPAAQSDLKEPGTIELERIYISKDFQGKGLGAKVLRKAIAIAQKFNPEYLWLGVWEHNGSAIRFYEKHGFVKFGEHPYWLGSDKQTDWLMRLPC
ncbi:GNAT family N-acetyltransferase [Sungkyunkwania multivorans]|uniref:GNAT family N-acetyltransferase n=1 Tax=Sungkyunkwania multivorans TaxID=1173618 RepID=A0ABW3D1T4_9FLAO